MLQFNSLTNVRPTKDLGCQIIASPTSGQFKVTPEAAKALEVVEGDYVQLVDAQVDGETKFFAVKGSKELGGGKLGAANKTGSGILTFSGAKAWDDMGGDTDYNTMFELKTGEDVIEQGDRKYFPLVQTSKEEKQKRKTSKAETTTVEASNEASLTEEAPVVEETTSFEDI